MPELNVLGGQSEPCGTEPLTGFRTRRWSALPPMRTPRDGMGVVATGSISS